MKKTHLSLLLMFTTVTLSAIPAVMAMEEESISLRGTTDGKTIELNWDALVGENVSGYRIVWGLFENPSYPPGPNDYYDTLRKVETDTYTIDYLLNTGKYYVRICAFDSEENCLFYSNQTEFQIEEIAETDEAENPLPDESGSSEEQTGELPEEIPLTDISGHKNRTAIEYLYLRGVIEGYPDLTFRPDATVNRAELIKILVGGQGMIPDAEQFQNCFPDVNDEWFAPYVCYAKTAGWISGYPDGTFGPGKTVNKAEAIKMLVNSQKIILPATISEYPFFDVTRDNWFSPYVQAAKDKNLLEEIGSLYNPEAEMTRAGISENIYRAMYIEEQELEKFPE